MASAVNLGSINMPKILRQIKHRTKQVKDLVFIRDPIFRKDVKTRKADVVTELTGPPVSFGYSQGGQNTFDTQETIDSAAGFYGAAGRHPDVAFHIDSPPLVIPNIMAFQSPIESGGDIERSGFRGSGACKFYIPSFEQLKQAEPLFNAAQFTDFETYDKFIEMDKVIYSHPEISITEKKSISIPLNSPVMATVQDYDYIDTADFDLVDYLTQDPVFSSGGISGIEIDRVQFKIKMSGGSGSLYSMGYMGHALAGERRSTYLGDGNNRPFGYGDAQQIIAPNAGIDNYPTLNTDGNAYSYNCWHQMLFSSRPVLKQDEWFTVDVAIPKDVWSKERISQKESFVLYVNTSDKTKLIDQYVVAYDSIKWGGTEIKRAGAAQGTGENYCFWFQVDGTQTAPGQKPHFASITIEDNIKVGDTISIYRGYSSEKFIASATGSESGDSHNRYFQLFTTSTVASEATVTITDLTELNNGDKVNLIATDGTSHDFTVGEVAGGGTWIAETNNNTSATNLAAAINANAKFSAAASSAVVTATQATAGIDGNTTVTLTDSFAAGMTKTNFSSPSAIVKTADALEAAINTHKSSLTTTRMMTYAQPTIILLGSSSNRENSYIGTYPYDAGYKINRASAQRGGFGLSALTGTGGGGFLGFYGGNSGFNNTIEVDISAATTDEEIATALAAAINTQTGIFTAVATLPSVGSPSVKLTTVVPNPIPMGQTHYVSFGLIDRAVAYDGYLRIGQITDGAGLAGGEFIEGPYTDENIYVTYATAGEPTTTKLQSLYGGGGFDLARMHGSSEYLQYLPGYYERTGLTHFYIELFSTGTFKIKDLKFYKENEWRIDSVKKYSEEYTVINAVQVRGGRDSRKRAYGGATRGASKELGVHG